MTCIFDAKVKHSGIKFIVIIKANRSSMPDDLDIQKIEPVKKIIRSGRCNYYWELKLMMLLVPMQNYPKI